ncbi:MAG TPA: DUF2235 domain-containing protein [Hyphomicrobiaceae bacterium]|nr:DUF2235 domain-containing protein [Hyphomicrobiaceae bacterium]
MSTKGEVAKALGRVELGIRKGSRIAPLMLLLLMSLLFIIYGLPSGFDQLGASLKLTQSPNDPLTLDKLAKALEKPDAFQKIMATISSMSAWEFVTKIVRPAIKVYIDQLISQSGMIITSVVKSVLQLGLYALLPGLAGLVYRRNFLGWFLTSFAVLAGINASGAFGSLTTAQPMPGAGAILVFVLSQLLILILAYRLRRHSQGLNVLPPRIQNWGLTAVLVVVGIACWQGWGPGYSSGGSKRASAEPEFRILQVTPVPTTADDAKRAPDPGKTTPAPPSSTPAPLPAGPGAAAPKKADTDAKPAPTSSAPTPPTTTAPRKADSGAAVPKTAAGTSSSDAGLSASTGATRSWIWSFLGTGVSGWIYKWEFILLGLPIIYTLLRNSAFWTGRTPKNIVICLDGTSNTPDQIEMGFLAQTNVFKLFNMLKADKAGAYQPIGSFDASLAKRFGDKQMAFYYAGVGNKYDNDPIFQTLGMATGMGAADIVERAYIDLVRVYKPGDRVFIFGFSRGAAISRLLARTIDARGAPRSMWTLRLFGKHRCLWRSTRRDPVPIDVLGCWDTVGSFGVAKTIAGINFQQLNMFRDLSIPDNVAQAYHMVALDEMRDSFEPTLMDPDPIRPERIVEVWFSGDHANIGGGWATDKLSDITLDFLLRRISSGYATDAAATPGDENWGLYLSAIKADKMAATAVAEPGAVATVDPDPLGQVRSWFSNLYVYRPRKLPLYAVISESVFDRMTKAMPVYAPQSLFDLNDALDAKRDLIEAKVAKLTETNSLDDEERKAIIEFNRKLRLSRFPKYWEALVAERAPQPVAVVLSNAELNVTKAAA